MSSKHRAKQHSCACTSYIGAVKSTVFAGCKHCCADENSCKMLIFNMRPILLLMMEFSLAIAGDAQRAPLEIIWHVPTQGKWGCGEEYGIPINVTQYGMLENSNPRTDGLQGEIITILYQNLGRWPYIKHDGQWKDGGLPQVP